jgi:hypothetical protein
MSDPKDAYRLLEKIGTGSIASTYRGLQKNLDRQVLVKILHPHLAGDREFVSRFEREAKACASLRHANVISIFDFGKWEDSYFISMEWVDGKSLSELLKRAGRLPPDIAFEITRQVCDGLSYAHSQGIIHRDIKPANIMLSPAGDAKISDFGPAYAAGMPSLTIEGALVGTPAFMSPEQAQSLELDRRTDIFSLGLTTYEMMTGQVVYAAETYSKSITRVITEDVKPIRAVDPTIDGEAGNILSRMLQRDRNKRYDDCGQISESIEKWAQGKKTRLSMADVASFAARPSVSEVKPAVVTVKGRARLRTTAIAAGATALAVFLIFTGQYRRSERNQPAAQGDTTLKAKAEVSVPAADKGSVFIDSKPPGARVRLDGNWISSTTPCDINDATPGSHKAVLYRAGFDSTTVVFKVEAGNRTSFTLDLIKMKTGYGLVRFRIVPWAKVFIDGKYLDTTPIGKDVSIEEGMHLVGLENPDYPLCTESLRVVADSTVELSVDLSSRSGYLVIAASPWAYVFVDGAKIGTTPMSKPVALSTGTHELILSNPGFVTYVETLRIESKKTIERIVKMKARG